VTRFSGKKLKRARKAKSMSRYKLAVALEVTPQSIVNWEMGTHVPNAEHLVRIAYFLVQPVDYFFEEGSK